VCGSTKQTKKRNVLGEFTALNDVQSQPRQMAKSEGMMMEANLKMLLTLHQQIWFDRLMCKM
jgi:hypothetical protein